VALVLEHWLSTLQALTCERRRTIAAAGSTKPNVDQVLILRRLARRALRWRGGTRGWLSLIRRCGLAMVGRSLVLASDSRFPQRTIALGVSTILRTKLYCRLRKTEALRETH